MPFIYMFSVSKSGCASKMSLDNNCPNIFEVCPRVIGFLTEGIGIDKKSLSR